ncbi:MAG: hypothetical protein AAGA76_07370 [Pseudomonadota bacterium]
MKRLLPLLLFWGVMHLPAYALEPGTPVIKAQSGNADYRVSVLE